MLLAPVLDFVIQYLQDTTPNHLEGLGLIYVWNAMIVVLYAQVIRARVSSVQVVTTCRWRTVPVYHHVQTVLLKAIPRDMDYVLIAMWSA